MANEFTYTPVTNTHKINAHFALCKDEPLIIQQGSQGASKTVSDLMLIIDWFRNNPSKEITICSSEKTKLMDTAFNDLKKICLDWNIWKEFKWNDVKTKLTSPRGTGFVEFIGLDKDDIGKGRRRDLIYINECNKVSHQKYFDISQRAKKVLVDFNADKRFYIHDLINDKNFIQLDFRGNEKLSKEEVRNILSYKAKGYQLDDNGDFVMDNGKRVVINEFYANKWRVYGEGEIGSVEGRVFTNWKKCSFIEYRNLSLKSFYAIDWGKNHKFGIVELKFDKYTNTLYCHELNYLSENEILSELSETERLKMDNFGGVIIHTVGKLGIPKNSDIVCDSAVPDNIILLRKYGWEYAYGIDKPKGSVMAGITLLQSTNVIYTDCSRNVDIEYHNYSYAKDRVGVIDDEVVKEYDDLIDPIRYGRRHAKNKL